MKALILLLLLSLVATAAGRSFDRVIIDAGHGGKDKGALWGGVRESKLNLQIALRVEKLLVAKGIPVTMTRRKDTFMSLRRRASVANRYPRAVFVSIHHNACRQPSVRGLETYYAGLRGKVLGFEIHRRIVAKTGMKDRGLRRRPYWVLRQTTCPAILLECGYLSNGTERKTATLTSQQKKIAEAIVDGLVRFRR